LPQARAELVRLSGKVLLGARHFHLEGAIILAIAHMIIRWITEPSPAKA